MPALMPLVWKELALPPGAQAPGPQFTDSQFTRVTGTNMAFKPVGSEDWLFASTEAMVGPQSTQMFKPLSWIPVELSAFAEAFSVKKIVFDVQSLINAGNRL